MRLTSILEGFKRAYPGNMWRGKHRKYKKVTEGVLQRTKDAYEIEEKNLFYLRHPYLTREQSFGHSKALGNKQAFVEEYFERKRKDWRTHVYLGDRFGFLKVFEKWD